MIFFIISFFYFHFFCTFALAYLTVVWNTESFCFSAVDCSLHLYVKSIYLLLFFFLIYKKRINQ